MRVVVFGAGLVGRRTAALLADIDGITPVVRGRFGVIDDDVIGELAPGIEVGRAGADVLADGPDIAVLATPTAAQPRLARRLVDAGVPVISTADGIAQIGRMVKLDARAVARGTAVVVGAAYSPGVSSVMAAHLARGMTEVSAIRTAQFGTGGPACAREHHRAMGASGQEVADGRLRTSRGGTGRELVWFPEPAGPADCYRAGLAEPVLLHHAFPSVPRIEARQAATRRDRMTSRLPMLRAPHAEGLVGAVWIEVRGRVDGRVEHRTMAASGPQATGAAAMAAACCLSLHRAPDSFPPGVTSPAQIERTVSILEDLSTSVRFWVYDGAHITTTGSTTPAVRAARKWKFLSEIPANTTI